MASMGEVWTQLGSALASLMFVWAIFQQYFPPQLRGSFNKYVRKGTSFVYPYIQITFDEFTGERLMRSEAFSAIQNYLSTNSNEHVKRFKADFVKDSKSLVLSMDDHEEVTDEFNGVKVWWESRKFIPQTKSFSYYPATEERRSYKLIFHKRDKKLVTGSYLTHVLDQGKAIAVKKRQRKLYSNNPSQGYYGYRTTRWSHVCFEHPATFDTLAMQPKKKEEILNDLRKFSKGKEYYAKIGKAWKRGYLLYGPPGTGKSTMIAALANFLNYDVYDLELTAVKDNTELRRLLIDTSNKSIIVIEDIDCSLDLTGQREKTKKKKKKEDEEETDPVRKKAKEEDENNSKVTLSGLLNFIDGLWSACGGERIIVFTTNHVEKLDPALIRRGRMDMRIEMSYCCFDAFKVLAKNYLDLDSHELYGEIRRLLDVTDMTPADVAENLMPKSDDEDAEICLKRLIEALEEAKEEARKKSEEEARKKAEEEERMKAEKEEKDKGKSAEEEVKENGKSSKRVKENGTLAQEVKENGVVACGKEGDMN